MQLDRRAQAVLARLARRADGGEDAAARGVQLLVARAARPQGKLPHTVAAEGCVSVAVDEAGNRAQPAAVELDHVFAERREVAHLPDGLDRLAVAEDECVLEHLDLAERRSSERSIGAGRCRKLREVAHQQPRAGIRHASAAPGMRGIRSPRASAAAIASG